MNTLIELCASYWVFLWLAMVVFVLGYWKADLNYPGVRAKKEKGVSASTGIRDQRALPRR